MIIPAKINFNHKLQKWDGFGVNYVEVAQTPDYREWPQEYGGFSTLCEEKRREILDMIFGEGGLKPCVFKMFIDCFQQDEEHLNEQGSDKLDLDNYDHETTTKWMRYFLREGLRITRERGGDLKGVATLYGPPAFMTKIKKVRGRDMDPAYKTECAKYIVAFAKYMREREGLPVKYLSIHNEGEDFYRWPEDGSDPNIGSGHDYNLYWSAEAVAEFLPLLKRIADANCEGLGVTPGECTGWTRFSHWGHATEIAEDPEALKALDLITSHGFYGEGINKRWSESHTDAGIAMIRRQRPELHAWVTSTSWRKMDATFILEMHHNIYEAGVNAIIPWAAIQTVGGWVGGDPNPGCAVSVDGNGGYTVQKGYYYYKQLSRIGQSGMHVAATSCALTAGAIIAFSGEGTEHPDAFVTVNSDSEDRQFEIKMVGGAKAYRVTRTSPDERYVDLGIAEVIDGRLRVDCPADSVTTFVAM